jgi:hypothetical protein
MGYSLGLHDIRARYPSHQDYIRTIHTLAENAETFEELQEWLCMLELNDKRLIVEAQSKLLYKMKIS